MLERVKFFHKIFAESIQRQGVHVASAWRTFGRVRNCSRVDTVKALDACERIHEVKN